MDNPTREQYARFGEAVAGILDGYTFDLPEMTTEERNSTLARAIVFAAEVYGIEPKELV